MKNKDKYTNEFIELTIRGDRLAVGKNGAIGSCFYTKCNNCIFDTYETCQQGRKEWMNRESEILDEAEKKYLSAVIEPWWDQVECIRKLESYEGMEMISIVTESSIKIRTYVDLPPFAKNTMYQGLEVNKEYTLEDLGL